jgi:hypothetical protein
MDGYHERGACAAARPASNSWLLEMASLGITETDSARCSANIVSMERKAVNMTNSKQIAGLIGPTLIVLTISEAMNLHIWANNIAPVTYLNGLLLFVAGLSIVRVHNHWTIRWPVAGLSFLVVCSGCSFLKLNRAVKTHPRTQ